MEAIRAQLSATLAGGRVPPSGTDLSRSVNRNNPGLGLLHTGHGSGVEDGDIFDEYEHQDSGLSLEELKRAVEERKRTRPAGIERQVSQPILCIYDTGRTSG